MGSPAPPKSQLADKVPFSESITQFCCVVDLVAESKYGRKSSPYSIFAKNLPSNSGLFPRGYLLLGSLRD